MIFLFFFPIFFSIHWLFIKIFMRKTFSFLPVAWISGMGRSRCAECTLCIHSLIRKGNVLNLFIFFLCANVSINSKNLYAFPLHLITFCIHILHQTIDFAFWRNHSWNYLPNCFWKLITGSCHTSVGLTILW